MATPIVNNLILPIHTILVECDEGSETTGVIFRRSSEGGGHFRGSAPIVESSHILFVKEMVTKVEIDEVEYLAMHEDAVVGLIP